MAGCIGVPSRTVYRPQSVMGFAASFETAVEFLKRPIESDDKRMERSLTPVIALLQEGAWVVIGFILPGQLTINLTDHSTAWTNSENFLLRFAKAGLSLDAQSANEAWKAYVSEITACVEVLQKLSTAEKPTEAEVRKARTFMIVLAAWLKFEALRQANA